MFSLMDYVTFSFHNETRTGEIRSKRRQVNKQEKSIFRSKSSWASAVVAQHDDCKFLAPEDLFVPLPMPRGPKNWTGMFVEQTLSIHWRCLCCQVVEPTDVKRAARLFHRDGFVVVKDVLSPEQNQNMADTCKVPWVGCEEKTDDSESAVACYAVLVCCVTKVPDAKSLEWTVSVNGGASDCSGLRLARFALKHHCCPNHVACSRGWPPTSLRTTRATSGTEARSAGRSEPRVAPDTCCTTLSGPSSSTCPHSHPYSRFVCASV